MPAVSAAEWLSGEEAIAHISACIWYRTDGVLKSPIAFQHGGARAPPKCDWRGVGACSRAVRLSTRVARPRASDLAERGYS